MIRRFIYLLLATVVLGGLAGGIAWYAFEFKPKFLAEVIMGSPQPPATIAAEAARHDQWQPQISGIGTLTADQGIDISPQVGGVIDQLNFDSGQDVKKGQGLVTLNDDTDQAQLRSVQAQLKNAETSLARREGLSKRGLAATAEIDELRAERDRLAANVEQLNATIAQKTIVAPWDGRVGLREVSLGSYVAPGQKIVWLQNIDPIFADFTITEADYSRIKPGQKVTAELNAFPDQLFNGEIVTTDSRLSNESRMLTVRARLANPERRLLPGMYANILVDSGESQTVITVPQTAVTFSLYGDNVFVIVPATKLDPKAKPEELAVERRFVKLGAARDNRVQIISGLIPGDQVVVAGQNKIDQGAKVVINNSVALKTQVSSSIQ